jgi:hypothetical protein
MKVSTTAKEAVADAEMDSLQEEGGEARSGDVTSHTPERPC